jgi:hypothetical protein
MSQLTALQLAIKKFKSESNLSWESGNYTDAHTYDYVVQELTKLLETEQNQIINANIAGMEFIPVDPTMYKQDAEQYYNETYNK